MKFDFNLNIKPTKTLSAFLEARTQSWVEDFFSENTNLTERIILNHTGEITR